MDMYVDKEIIKGFKSKGPPFDYTKLINLLEGLNDAYFRKNPHQSAITIRAILDHIPPLLGYSNFESVSNNYPWSSTYKKYMENLLDFKNEGDDSLHTQISDKKDFLTVSNLPPSNRINILLQECLKKGSNEELINAQALKIRQSEPDSKINIELLESRSWQNYSSGFFMGYSYSFTIKVDNFKNNNPDYLKIFLKANSNDGEWIGEEFIFETDKPTPNLPYEVEPKKDKDISVIISDQPFKHGVSDHRFRPGIDEDTLILVVQTKTGKKFEFPVNPGSFVY